MDLGRVGIWHFLDLHPAAATQAVAREIEELGFKALWIPERLGREAFTPLGAAARGHEAVVIVRRACACGRATRWRWRRRKDDIAEAILTASSWDGRVARAARRRHARPRLRQAAHVSPRLTLGTGWIRRRSSPRSRPRPAARARVAASKSLELARERAWGSHPYFVPPEHTAKARKILGPGKLLAPEQMVCFEKDPSAARAVARQAMQTYLGLPNYVRNLKALGWTDGDLANGGSDKLVDAIVAWGGIDAVVARVKAHHDAGADHVCLQVLRPNPVELPREEWREIAAAFLR
jgi:hypothetical protein